MDSPKPPKSFVESKIYEAHKGKITKNTALLDKVTYAITFAIASKPEIFPFANEAYGIRIAKSDAADNIPALTIYFKEYKDQVVLLDIEVTKQDTTE